jgi:DNA-binding HxlR family transcriptional regulator
MAKTNYTECSSDLLPVRDALDVISGKWKLLILISISSGNHRFTEIERSIPKITSKVLSKELKDLEENQLIKRTVYVETPVVIDYSITAYAKTLQPVINALSEWGSNHRKRIMKK